jgi:hypothetical protein
VTYGLSVSEPDEQLRVSDAERESVAGRLNAAVGEGRLNLDEFSQRISAAYGARRRGELDVLVRDLPAEPENQATSRSPVVFAGSDLTATIGAVKKNGRWLLGSHTTVAVAFGPIKLDLREAELATREVIVSAHTTVGPIKVWVPSGVRVYVDGSTRIGTRTIEESNLAESPDAPTLRLRLDTGMGTVKVYRT